MRFDQWLHRYMVFRRLSLLVALHLTVITTYWSMGAADRGLDSLTIGSVLGPVSILLAAVIKFQAQHPYADGGNP